MLVSGSCCLTTQASSKELIMLRHRHIVSYEDGSEEFRSLEGHVKWDAWGLWILPDFWEIKVGKLSEFSQIYNI